MPDEIDPATGLPVTTATAFNVDDTNSPTPEQLRAQQAAIAAGQQPPVQLQQQPPTPRWTDEDIERVRTEERNKLHGQLNSVEQMQADLADLKRLRAEEEAEKARLIAEAEEAARKAEEEKMSTKALLERRTQEWDQKFAEVTTTLATERATADKERQFHTLMEYRNNKITAFEQAGGVLIPNMVDLIGGNSEAEIDASLASIAAKSQEIIDGIRQQQQQAWQAMPGTLASAPPMGPLENEQGTKTYTAEDINSMSMADWARHRGQLLRASGQAFRNGQR